MECFVRLCGHFAASTQLHPLVLHLARTAQYVLLDIVILEYLTPGLMPDAFAELINILDTVSPPNLLVCVLLIIIVGVGLRVKLTIFRGVYLICLRSCFKGDRTQDTIINIITCSFSLIAMFIQWLQNTDTSYKSTDFMRYPSPSLSIISTVITCTIAVISLNSLPLSAYLPLCSTLLALSLVIHLLYPSANQTQHRFDTLVYSWLLSQLPLSFAFQFAAGNRIARNAWILLGGLAAGIVTWAEQKIRKWKTGSFYEISEEEITGGLKNIMREFRKAQLTQQLKWYCERVAKFVEFEKTEIAMKIPTNSLGLTNKLQWQRFVYQVVSLCVNWQHGQFNLLIDCAYCEDELKNNWHASILILRKLEARGKSRSQTSQTMFFNKVFQQMDINRALLYLNQKISKIESTRQINFNQYKKVDSILSHSLKISEMYLDLWHILSQKQVFTQKVVHKALKVRRQVQKLDRQLKKLDFKCNLLRQHMASFDSQVRLNKEVTTKRISEDANKVNQTVLKPELEECVAIQISLDQQDLGDILNMGMNQNLLELEQSQEIPKLLKRPNIRNFMPSMLQSVHHQKMSQVIWQQSHNLFAPYDKSTYLMVNKKLYMAKVHLKLALVKSKPVAVGFIKINKKTTIPCLILLESPTNKIIAHSPQAGSFLRLDRMSQKNISFTQQPDFVPGYSSQVIFTDPTLETEDTHNFECIKVTQIEKDSKLILIRIDQAIHKIQHEIGLNLISDCMKQQIATFRLDQVFSANIIGLQKFNKAKQEVSNIFSQNTLKKLTIALTIILLILSVAQVLQLFINNMYQDFSVSYLTTLSDNGLKTWLTRRTFLQLQLFDLTLQNRYNITTVNLDERSCLQQMLDTLTQINKNQTKLAVGFHQKVNVSGMEIKNVDVFQIYNQGLAKMKFLSEVNATDQTLVTKTQIAAAFDFLYANHDVIEMDSNREYLGSYIQKILSQNKAYKVHYYCHIVLACGIALAMVAITYKVQQRRLSLKIMACETLFLIDQKQIFIMISLVQDYKQRLKLPPIKENSTFAYSGYSSNLTGASERRDSNSESRRSSIFKNLFLRPTDQGILMTDDEIIRTTNNCNNKQRSSTLEDNSQDSMPRKIFNKARPCNWILLLLYFIFASVIISLQCITILHWQSQNNAIKSASSNFQLLNSRSAQFSHLANKYTFLILGNSTNTTYLQHILKQTEEINQRSLDLLDYAIETPDLQYFHYLLSRILYIDTIKYYSSTRYQANISMVLDNVVRNLILELRKSYPSIPLGSVPGTLLDYMAWVDYMIYTLYQTLGQAFLQGMGKKFFGHFTQIFKFTIISTGITLAILFCSVIYNVFVLKTVKKYLGIMQIVKGSYAPAPPPQLSPQSLSYVGSSRLPMTSS